MKGRRTWAAAIGRWETYPPIKKGLDPGIAVVVNALRRNGIQTVESCQGGKGHGFPVPTVIFWGSYADGLHALAVAIGQRHAMGMLPSELRLVWKIRDGLPAGPEWWLTWR